MDRDEHYLECLINRLNSEMSTKKYIIMVKGLFKETFPNCFIFGQNLNIDIAITASSPMQLLARQISGTRFVLQIPNHLVQATALPL